ncbi:MAG: transcriptional repressor [Chloroflexi bacterium]|nr:transcriptional repressor [Chloroflexota bacterium]
MENAARIFEGHLKLRGLKSTRQRQAIFNAFIESSVHLSAEELYRKLRKKNPGIGLSTVYRTLKLLCDCGLARALQLDDNMVTFEKESKRDHHDHMVCRECGRIEEFYSKAIEDLQERVAKKHGFIPEDHRMKIIGLCKECARRKAEK